MSLLNGAVSFTRFVLEDELPPEFRGMYEAQISKYAFFEPPVDPKGVAVIGWCHIDNLMKSDFSDPNSWLINDNAMFSLRIDQKRLPSRRFKDAIRVATEKWCVEHDVSRCPSSVRQEIKENLRDEWLCRQIPVSQTVDIAMTFSTREVWVATNSVNKIDEVRKRFFHTFGIRIIPRTFLSNLDDKTVSALVPGLDKFGAQGLVAMPGNVTDNFYMWLLDAASKEKATIKGMECDLWIDDRLSLRHVADIKPTIVISGDKVAEGPEAEAGLKAGKVPESVRFGLRDTEDFEYTFSLNGPGAKLSMKIPKPIDGSTEREEHLIERVFIIQRGLNYLDGLFEMYANDVKTGAYVMKDNMVNEGDGSDNDNEEDENIDSDDVLEVDED